MNVPKDARASTDECLQAKRRETDDEPLEGRPEHSAGRSVNPERRRGDALLLDARDHRASADALRDDERDAGRRVLTTFLQSERATSDHRRGGERPRADQAVASREDFLAMVSHDLKTLLAAMLLGTDVLLGHAPRTTAGVDVRHSAERLRRLVATMSRLVSDLLDVAGIESGRMAVHPEPNDAVRLLGDALDAFRPLATARGIRLAGEVHRAPLVGWFDEQRILQVIANLLSNAIKFSPRGSAIEMSVERVGRELRFTVRDEGHGISADMLSAIFERFRQVIPGGRTGLGLGLFISRSIVEAHGGRIWAESNIGQGSAFRVALPDAREPAATA